jgi:homoserine kinase type II
VALTVVEMAGMVGAGKTTLASVVAADLEGRGYRVLRPAIAITEVLDRSFFGALSRRLLRSATARRRMLRAVYRGAVRPWYTAMFVMGCPGPIWSAMRAQWRSPLPGWHRRKILSLLLRLAAAQLYLSRRMRPDEVLLLEEGMVHRAVNVFAWSDGDVDLAAVGRYVTGLPRTDLVVLVTAPLSVCIERADARGLPRRLAGRDDATVARFMRNAAVIVDVLPDLLSARSRPSVVVHNGGALDAAVTALQEAIGFRLDATTVAAPEGAGCPAPDEGPARAPRTPRFHGGLRMARPALRRGSERHPPRLSPAEVTAVLAVFDINASDDLKGISATSRADNVVVTTSAGRKLLKRYKASVTAPSVVHEHSILRHLNALDFPTPRLVAAADGATAREVGGRWHALFDYLPGYFHYHEHLWPPRTYRTLVGLSAQALGALHEALDGFSPQGINPNGFASLDGPRHHDLQWYLEGLERARAHRRDADGGAAFRAMLDREGGPVEQQLRALDRELAAADLPRQVIHGDYGPYNLLFRRGERVVILDFELARIDWRVADVAKSLQQFGVTRHGLRPRRIAAFVDAYDRRRPLTPVERRLLPDVWRFLTLRRVIVCWDRYTESQEARWLAEARRKLSLVEMIQGFAVTLSAFERVGGTRWRT